MRPPPGRRPADLAGRRGAGLLDQRKLTGGPREAGVTSAPAEGSGAETVRMPHDVDRDFPGVLIPGPGSTELFVRRWTSGTRSPRADRGRPAVLYVHGATFPSNLSVGYAIDGRSWAGEMAAAGLDVWSIDFVGYGSSSRYP